MNRGKSGVRARRWMPPSRYLTRVVTMWSPQSLVSKRNVLMPIPSFFDLDVCDCPLW